MQRTSDRPDWQPGLRSTVLIGGRFQLLDEIGLGATAVVYKAREVSTGAVVALKVLKGSAAIHPRLLAGFKREAEIGETIKHPNIIQIQGFGVHDSWIYLVMEYVTGRTLSEVLSLYPRMALPEFEQLCRQLLSALECIHANGIVHRDLKPGNLMMTQAGNWKLMDFGISRKLETPITVGAALGTPDYMSPEQLMGETATPASDLHAAGILFYEVLAGKRPFQDWRFIDRCTKRAGRLRELRASVPLWLDEMISRCLEAKPDDRYRSAREMQDALGTFEESTIEVRAPIAEAVAFTPPIAVEPSYSLGDYHTDQPGKADEVLDRFLNLFRLLQQDSARSQRHEPLTPWTVRIYQSGRMGIAAHNPSGTHDTLMVEIPKYASPEMLRGRGIASSPERVRSDMYVLGFMMYEQLLGRNEFRAEFRSVEDEGSGLAWMAWHSDSVKTLRPLSELIPTLPAGISNLVAEMTAKNPDNRASSYESALLVLQGLLHRVQPTQQLRVPVLSGVGQPEAAKSKAKWGEATVLLISAALTLVLMLAIATALHFWK